MLGREAHPDRGERVPSTHHESPPGQSSLSSEAQNQSLQVEPGKLHLQAPPITKHMDMMDPCRTVLRCSHNTGIVTTRVWPP